MMESRFEQFHPFVTFLYYAGAVTLMLMLLHPIFLCAGIFILLAVNFLHDHLNGVRRWLFLIIASVFFMLIINPLFNERGRHLLFMIGNHRFTLEAFVYSGMYAMSIAAVMIVFISYNVVMTPNKLLFLFAKFLPQVAVLLMLTLRFIPLMRRRVEEISQVQRSRGITVTSGTWRTKVNHAMQYVQILLTFSLEEAIQTADSMKARSYGQGQRTTYEFFRLNLTDIFAIVYLVIFLTLTILGRCFGYGFLTVYPVMEPWQLSSTEVQLLIGDILFLLFPILTEAGEVFRWRILK
jgi:energy-coupling factor transport system permease protein